MTIGIPTRKTLIASVEESSEKTYAPPAQATDFFSPIEYPNAVMTRETKDREQVDGNTGVQKPLLGMRSGTVEFAQEFRGSGTPGTEPEWGLHAESALGQKHLRTSDVILAAASSTTVLKLATQSDITEFRKMDGMIVKDSVNGYSVRFVKSHGESVTISADTNDWLDVDEGSGEVNIQVAAAAYATPELLAAAIQLALNESGSLALSYSVTYAESTGLFTIASTANFDLLWKTGAHGSDNLDDHIGTQIGFDDAADDTAASSFAADNLAYDEITISPALSNAPAAAVTVSGVSTYSPANEGHPSLSFTTYQGDEIVDKHVGCKATTMSIGNLATGEIPQVNFAFQALSYNAEVDGSAAITPVYQDQLPAVALGVELLVDGTSVCANNISVEMASEVTKITCMTDDDGAVFQRVTKFDATGNYDPWADDTTVVPFTKFDNNTDVEIMVAVGQKDASGDWVPGSVTAVYMPQVVYTEIPWEDSDGVLRRAIGLRAHRGEDGSKPEISVAAM